MVFLNCCEWLKHSFLLLLLEDEAGIMPPSTVKYSGMLLVLIGLKVLQWHQLRLLMHCEKQFINTHWEVFLPSKLVISDKIRQEGGDACLRWQDNSEMLT